VDWDRGPSCRPMSVLAVYGPVERGPARASFLALDGPLQAALAAGTGPAADVFMAGDFNCTLPTPGVTTSFGGAVRAQCAEQLQALVAAAGLVDVWASLASQGVNLRGYKQEDAQTHISNTANGISTARLDYWFSPASLVGQGWAPKCTHRWDVAPSDHAAVELCWCSPHQAPKGRWRWRFPDSLLCDPDLVGPAKDA
jgi:hypothetical protein